MFLVIKYDIMLTKNCWNEFFKRNIDCCLLFILLILYSPIPDQFAHQFSENVIYNDMHSLIYK